MSNLHLVTQTLTLTLNGNRGSWLDSTIDLAPGEGLGVTATGAVKYHGSHNQWGYPEGSYPIIAYVSGNPAPIDAGNNGGHLLDLPNVLTYAQLNANPARFSIPQVTPYSLAMVLLPTGVLPTINNTQNAFTLNREYLADPLADSVFAGASLLRPWFWFNDTAGDYGDNSGVFTLLLQRYADSAIYVPPVRGGRFVPPALNQILRSQIQHPAWCWVVKPTAGDWEFYTSLDQSLTLPAYLSVNGAAWVPAATYGSGHGVDLTTMPVQLKMSTSGTDVTLLHFERAKLVGGYYFNAEIEVFEVDWQNLDAGRWVAFSGLFGNAVVGDLSATLELSSWDVVFESNRAQTITYNCSYAFCDSGCHNSEAGDGPTASDWTRLGTVKAVGAATLIQVQMSGGFQTDGARETSFYTPADRLAAWSLRLGDSLLTMANGSKNAGFAREVKLGKSLGGDAFELQMRDSFPRLPLVGDAIALRSGCAKAPFACQGYHNFLNYGGFSNLPLAEGMRRI